MICLSNFLLKTQRFSIITLKPCRSYLNILSKALKNDYISNITKKRLLSTDEAYLKEIQKKLSENKTTNILIYSVNSKGSITANIIGVVAGSMIILMSLNMWDLSGSSKFKSTSKSKEESGLFRRVLSIVSSDIFKYTACTATCLIGKYFCSIQNLEKLNS